MVDLIAAVPFTFAGHPWGMAVHSQRIGTAIWSHFTAREHREVSPSPFRCQTKLGKCHDMRGIKKIDCGQKVTV